MKSSSSTSSWASSVSSGYGTTLQSLSKQLPLLNQVATKGFCTYLPSIFSHLSFSLHSHLCAQDRLSSSPASLNPSFNHSHIEYKITLLKTLWQLPVAYDKIQPFIMVYKTHQESGPCIPLLGLSFPSGILSSCWTKLLPILSMPCSLLQMCSLCICSPIAWSTFLLLTWPTPTQASRFGSDIPPVRNLSRSWHP